MVARDTLEKVKKRSGKYFPGPCTDMAVAVALMETVETHYYYDAPLLVSGTAPKSASGLGANHQHKGEIASIKTLPVGTEKAWENTVPKIWTGLTIYTETASKALRNMGQTEELDRINLTFLYAKFFVFQHEYKQQLKETILKNKINRPLYYTLIIRFFLERCFCFVKNVFLAKFSIGKKTWENVTNSKDASKIISNDIGYLSF